jgi:putative membrane protein
MSRNLLLAGALALGALTAPVAHAQPGMSGPPPGAMMQALPTPDFLTVAAQSDEFERREGRMATERGVNPHVRQAGAQMVQAHTESTRKMKMAAARAGLPPMPPPALDAEQQQMLDRLQTARGPEFDRMYVHQQIMAHQKALGAMTAYAQGGPPGPVRRAAMEIRPIVQQHLDMFQGMQSMMR